MEPTLVVVLALLWGIVLLPAGLRGRRSSPTHSVDGFGKAMDVLTKQQAGGNGRYLMVPGDANQIVTGHRQDEVLGRRRRTFTGVLGTMVVALGLALTFSGPFWLLWGLTVTALVGYVALLLRLKAQRDGAREVVRQLPLEDREYLANAQRERHVTELERVVGGTPLQISDRPNDPWASSASVRIRRWDG